VKSSKAARSSARDAFFSSPTETVSVWPSSTGTRFVWALTRTGCISTESAVSEPRIFRVSVSIFSSSPEMNGITLPRMSSEGTPG
jgi:hypothetical protein